MIYREASFSNFIGFYQVENEKGDIKTASGTIVSVGSAGYIKAAVDNRVAGIDLTTSNQTTQLYNDKLFSPGAIYALFISTPAAVNGVSGDPEVYFSYLGANTDAADHIRLLGNNTFGFEDIRGGGDFDFNDYIVKAIFTPVV